MKLASLIGSVGIVALLSSLSLAQIGAGGLRGRVLDRDGKPLQGAVIRIENLGTRQVDDAKTNRNGAYSFVGLFQGQYKVTAIVDGRALMVRGEGAGDAIYVSSGNDATVNFDLRDAPATPPPTPAAPGAADGKNAVDEKTVAETKAAFEAGMAALKANNFEEAVKQFQAAADKDPKQSVVFANMGLALANLKKYDDAVAAYRKSIELKPDDPAIHALVSLALANAGKIDEASQAVQEVAKLDPSMAGQSYYNLGAILTNNGRSKEAVAAFTKAIEIDPKNANAYYQIGIAYFATPDTIPQAVTALEKYLQLQPAGPNAEAAKGLIEAAKAQIKARE